MRLFVRLLHALQSAVTSETSRNKRLPLVRASQERKTFLGLADLEQQFNVLDGFTKDFINGFVDLVRCVTEGVPVVVARQLLRTAPDVDSPSTSQVCRLLDRFHRKRRPFQPAHLVVALDCLLVETDLTAGMS